MKIIDYKLVDGVALIGQYLTAGYQPFGSPHIEVSGRVLQIMVHYEAEPAKQEKAATLQAKTAKDIVAAKGK